MLGPVHISTECSWTKMLLECSQERNLPCQKLSYQSWRDSAEAWCVLLTPLAPTGWRQKTNMGGKTTPRIIIEMGGGESVFRAKL
ncbi:hypothetical protein RRG08_051633 [Elysia crispata]|uniref:Uncharacterized protein n=1 Tax=Elysia crispata TaxID=231223 RepID=A0AAE1A2U8_9GAST|nr:hypothetical protein RRG08_051633 [Elysia crispata]